MIPLACVGKKCHYRWGLVQKYEKNKQAAVKQYLKKECTPKKKKFIWNKQEYECPTKPTDKT